MTQEAQRNLSFEAEFKAASKVGHSHGLKLGKEEIFKKTYSLAHQSSYQEELPAAHELGKADARRELNNNLATRPLLTMTETSLKAEEFRGSEEVNVLVKVKNISSVALNTAAIIRITQVEHAEIIKREAVLNTMQANSVADMPSLTVRVLPTSKAGDKLVVKGVIELPGDQYKAQRVESFKLEQVLSANPAHSLEKIFDASPSIKGIFRRNIHFLTAKIAPSLEDMPQGYKVSLTAVGENAGLINLNEKTLESGALKKGQVKEVKFSYTFPDGAKNKKIVLEIGVTFNNKVIRKEQIELFPH